MSTNVSTISCSFSKLLNIFSRYPTLPPSLSDERLTGDINHTEKILKKLFTGKWYIGAGLNKAFDTFDCQVHDFFEPELSSFGAQGRIVKEIADANFSYRIQVGDSNFFTKVGPKRLSLVEDNPSTTSSTKIKISNKHPMFEIAKKWGIDSFALGQNENNMEKNVNGYKLILTLRPDSMDYKDEWSILSYSDDDDCGFIVVAYRGHNSAWDGYGGLNVYTRSPANFQKLIEDPQTDKERIVLEDINHGLRKVGLSIKDLSIVDNSCNPKQD